MEKLSTARQLYNLIKIRERKEGQIRTLKWQERVVHNQLDREFKELQTILEDIDDLSRGNEADAIIAQSLAQA